MADDYEWLETGGYHFYVGGYEDIYGNHYNVEAGDAPLTEDFLAETGVDYVSVYVDELDRWIHVDGPFSDFIDLEYDVLDDIEEY